MVSRPTFRATPVTIRVPATSANLGAGFDCLGLALESYDGYAAQVLDEPGLDVEVAGEGAETLRTDEKNLVVASMNAAFDHMGGRPRGLALRALNAIPHGRGLGSSSSAIVGGLFLARSLVISGTERLNDKDLLALATEIEGHPDNVAAAFHGGATIAWVEDGSGKAISIPVDMRIMAIAFIPTKPGEVATKKARALLPETVPHIDAAINISRSTLMVEALSRKPELLFAGTEDRIHQVYRQSQMPRSYELMATLREAGVAAFISGSGPTVLALHYGNIGDAQEIARAGSGAFTSQIVGISAQGAHIFNG
jgi:homoserine kinase